MGILNFHVWEKNFGVVHKRQNIFVSDHPAAYFAPSGN